MLRTVLLMMLFASPVLAQDSAASALEAAGCGPNEVHFEVKTDKKQHPTTQPEAGKALVYVIGDTWDDHVAVHIGTPPTRFGIDGTWVGANGYRSYFFFSVEPGDHRLCTNVQAIIERVVKSSTAARSFTAEAGKSYYFRTVTPVAGLSGGPTKLVPVDPAEAQVLIAATAFSTFHLKK
ncbi:MAG: hypothetical protein WBE13_02900 [Candidatus Acidiferrum sp.]